MVNSINKMKWPCRTETSRQGRFVWADEKYITGKDEIKYEEHTGTDAMNMVK